MSVIDEANKYVESYRIERRKERQDYLEAFLKKVFVERDVTIEERPSDDFYGKAYVYFDGIYWGYDTQTLSNDNDFAMPYRHRIDAIWQCQYCGTVLSWAVPMTEWQWNLSSFSDAINAHNCFRKRIGWKKHRDGKLHD